MSKHLLSQTKSLNKEVDILLLQIKSYRRQGKDISKQTQRLRQIKIELQTISCQADIIIKNADKTLQESQKQKAIKTAGGFLFAPVVGFFGSIFR